MKQPLTSLMRSENEGGLEGNEEEDGEECLWHR